MKKNIIITIMLLCSFAVFSTAVAIDLSIYSYDELIELRAKLDAEIVSRAEFKKAIIPSGTWEIGVDIPAGNYSIETDAYITTITILDTNGKTLNFLTVDSSNPIGKIAFEKGWKIEFGAKCYLLPPKTITFF